MSVRKRTWESGGEMRVAYVVDYHQQGKRHWRQFKTEKEAIKVDAKIKHELAQGIHAPGTHETIATAGATWLAGCEANGLERGTMYGYEAALRRHIKPSVGAVKLSDFDFAAVEKFRDALLSGAPTDLKEDGMVKRSRTQTKSIMSCLSGILDKAWAQG